jgi:3,4-dihydroxy-2-butanone 4-phosphate synthase (EC 4.1.2.-)
MSGRLTAVDAAVDALGRGEPVCVYDAADREGETDLIYPAGAVTPTAVAHLRNDAGGLVCAAMGNEVATAFDLPFLQDTIEHPATANQQLEYDDRSSFSLSVNHRETRTGITDTDRAKTIQALEAAATAPDKTEFGAVFRSPGHVPLLRAAPSLADRRGHTELGIALAEAAGRAPVVVVTEMLADGDGALSRSAASAYAERNGVPYVEGSEIVTALG